MEYNKPVLDRGRADSHSYREVRVRPRATAFVCCSAVVLLLATPLNAQPRAKSTKDLTTVRAELAAVLLQSRKYDDAIREYRALVARDAARFEYRLGLARALAWAGRAREAERELRVLQKRNLQIAAVDSLLRTVRDAMKPTSSEAAAWVAERPSYGPYRLSLARALASEHDGRGAAAHYDTLMRGASLGRVPEPVVLRREQAQAYLAAGDLDAGAASLRDVLRYTPRDTALRHQLAVALVDARRLHDARAQYDTLLAERPSASMYVTRARLRFALGDRRGAEADLEASLPLGSTVGGYLMLGDVYRERGAHVAALALYRNAAARPDADDDERVAIAAAIARLEREDRPVGAFVPIVGDDPGWRFTSDGASDNLGVHYTSSSLRRTFALGPVVSVGAGALHHYLGERSPARRLGFNAVGGEAGVAAEGGYGPFFTRASVSGGALRVSDGEPIQIGGATVAAWYNAMQLALGASRGPAYPSLVTTTAVRAENAADNDVITEESADATVGGPIGQADVAVTAQQTWLSDGNRRRTLQGYLRYPVAPGVAVVYNAALVSFAKRSLRYWDPLNYAAHGLGLEVASHERQGLSVAARAIPGLTKSHLVPRPVPGASGSRPRVTGPVRRSAFQLGASGEMIWRESDWEGTAGVSYGRARTGDYRRFGVTLGVRVLP